eukprot:gene21020-27243_t
MVAKKSKSKRLTLQKKYKVERRTKEHHRKLKKGKINGTVKSKQKDNFIPNSWPYKEELLKEIKLAKEKMEMNKIKLKEKKREEQIKKKLGIPILSPKVSSSSNIKMDVIDDQMESDDILEVDEEIDIKLPQLGQNSRRAYLKELRKVIEKSDVILLVLDARDPLGTRSSAIEDMVLSNYRKKLVYILNKADLVPRDVLIGWLTYLRKLHPTVPFKCNTQAQKGNLSRISGKVAKQDDNTLLTSSAVGSEELISLLKNYCRVGDVKSIISVGIVGFPNVGKSSLINSLLRSRAVGVSSTPGFTKVSQEVILDKNIRLVDCPGVVFADGDSASVALRNCINVEEMIDFMTPIQAILDKCPQSYLMQLYTIPKFKPKDSMAFLALVAKTTGKLKKGGIPNIDAAAKGVLHDWNTGKIRFYCKPPQMNITLGSNELDTKILNSYSDEFNFNDIKVLNEIDLYKDNLQTYIPIEEIGNHVDLHIGDENTITTRDSLSNSNIKRHVNSNEDDSMIEEDQTSVSTKNTKSLTTLTNTSNSIDNFNIDESNRKLQKKLKKKSNKDIRRRTKTIIGEELQEKDYNFDEDFNYNE